MRMAVSQVENLENLASTWGVVRFLYISSLYIVRDLG